MPRAPLGLTPLLLALALGCSPTEREPRTEEEEAPREVREAPPEQPRVPVLEQRGVGCVPYAAASVAQFHGAEIDPFQLLRSLPVSRRGIAYQDVASALVERGLRAEVIHPSVALLREHLARGQPLVIGVSRDVRGDHALVVERYDGETYAIMDPANPGLRSLNAEELERDYMAAQVALLIVR